MEAVEAIAVVILVIAVLTLIYYYLQNSPNAMKKIRSYVPDNADAHMNDFISDDGVSGSTGEDLANDPSKDVEDEEKDGISKKIKGKLGDIDMSSFDTDIFSKKIDAFLNEKSDQLINEWSLVTTDKLDVLEDKFSKTTQSVDALENQFNQFKKNSAKFQEETEAKLDDLDKRIDSLENK